MSKQINELRRLFHQRMHEAGAQYRYGVVKRVDAQRRTCDVQIEGVVYEGVLLYAVEQAERKGWVALPKVDSAVIVATGVGGKRLLVVLCSEIDRVVFTIGDRVTFACDGTAAEYTNDRIRLKAEGNRIEVEADQFVFNGGDHRGLVNIEQLTAKINALIDVFNGHTHVILPEQVVVAGSATTQSNKVSIAVPAPQQQQTPVKCDDYEDTKGTH